MSSTATLNPVAALAAAPSSEVDAHSAQLKNDGAMPIIEVKLRVLNAAFEALEKSGLNRND